MRPGPVVSVVLTILWIGVAAGASTTRPLAAQEAISSQEIPRAAAEAIDQLWSPYCPGLMLEVCTSAGGAALRDSIQDQARAGMSADSIVDFWVARFGEEYRAVPTFTGAGRVAWVMPFAALAVGLAAAGLFLLRRSRRWQDRDATTQITPEDEARLTEALAALDQSERPDF